MSEDNGQWMFGLAILFFVIMFAVAPAQTEHALNCLIGACK